MRSRPHEPVVPGDILLHPLVLVAIGLLVLNDHVLKHLWPGLVTGKLSDVAGLLFFPLALVAAWEVALSIYGNPAHPSRTVILVAGIGSAILFAAAKITPVGNAMVGGALGWVQWLFASAVAWLGNTPSPRFMPAALVMDPGDLVALGAILASLWIGWRRVDQSRMPEAVA